MRTWFYGFLEMWTCTDKGSFGCLFACWCVGMSAYSWPTAPSFHMPLRPPLPWWESGEESICFVRFITISPEYVRFYFATS